MRETETKWGKEKGRKREMSVILFNAKKKRYSDDGYYKEKWDKRTPLSCR